MSIEQDNAPEKAISTLEYDKFQRLVDDFIDRSSRDFGEMPASSFFELLFDKMVEEVTETVDGESLRRFLESHQVDLIEGFIRQDLEWGLRGNEFQSVADEFNEGVNPQCRKPSH